MKSMQKLLPALLLALASPLLTLAGGPNPEHVPATAKAMIHIDCTALRETALYKAHRELKGDDNPFDAWLTLFSNVVGFHPLNDMDGVTFYTSAHGGEEGVAIWYGKADQQRVLKNAKNWPEYKTEAYGRFTIHTWRDNRINRTVAGAIVSDTVIVSASSVASIKGALDVFDGRTTANSTIARAFPKDAIAFAGMKDLGSAPRAAKSGAMANLEAMQFTFTETAGNARLAITAEAADPEVAIKSKQFLDGIKALMQLNAEKNPAAATLAGRINNTVDGKFIHTTVQGDSREILKDLIGMEKSRAATTKAAIPPRLP